MDSLPTLLPMLFAIVLMAALAKLSARIYRRTQLTWLRAFAYVALLAGIAFVMRSVGGEVRFEAPRVVALVIPVAVNLLVGGGYFGRYAHASDGTPIGFAHGAVLGLIFAVASVTVFSLPRWIAF